VPSKTPRAIVTKLHQNTEKAIRSPELNERMAKLGAEQWLMTPQEFDAYIRKEIAANAALVKAAGITVN
jgi:tripartite-type tricarboxylate transporter receptor subunit TctC